MIVYSFSVIAQLPAVKAQSPYTVTLSGANSAGGGWISSKCTDLASVQGNASAQVACSEIVAEIQTQAQNPSLWIDAANKIGAVYLYHGAIRGGCCACSNIFPSSPQTALSVCVLGYMNALLWYPISDLTWDGTKTIVNIYGFAGDNNQCSGLCSSSGIAAQDKEVTEEDQRLLPAKDGDSGTAVSGSYTEVFGGHYCHSDFSSNTDGAAEAMVHTIADNPPIPHIPHSFFVLVRGAMITYCPIYP